VTLSQKNDVLMKKSNKMGSGIKVMEKSVFLPPEKYKVK
jgi:hypothetical protein